MNDYYVPGTQKGVFGNATAWVLATLALIGVVVSIIGVVRWVSAPTRGKLQAREQINSGAFRIAAYNHFFDLCAAVQSDEARLEAQYVSLSTATGEDVARIQANIAGITSDRADAVNEYNADASKDYTVGQFKSSKLPYQLDATYTRGDHTSCAA